MWCRGFGSSAEARQAPPRFSLTKPCLVVPPARHDDCHIQGNDGHASGADPASMTMRRRATSRIPATLVTLAISFATACKRPDPPPPPPPEVLVTAAAQKDVPIYTE